MQHMDLLLFLNRIGIDGGILLGLNYPKDIKYAKK
jgi:uncharacterized metal-binding protein